MCLVCHPPTHLHGVLPTEWPCVPDAYWCTQPDVLPDSPDYIPKFCDPQLFQEHVWFWEPGLAVRTLGMMIPIYHDIVGRGMVMELAFSINRDGLVQDTHAVVCECVGSCVLGVCARACV